ncbi:hypothetical protein [Sediminicoccus sp. KRV36]|uniref:hypothetical protein n=1 Tax=Sediminicoccus sp. KRV36 TaxID=3133721 RepID=UPI00200CA344|nr:hypothetical protein [Sediminicoccus rosea]UPY35522.1 hypothetical protein LHU95_14985 [Sediminicoccus rosea]
MTQHPIHTLPPAELRGYARGLREGAARLVHATPFNIQSTRADLLREADLTEGFAARLEGLEVTQDDAEEEAEEGNLIVFWLAQDPDAGHFETAEDAAYSVPVLEPFEIASNAWPTTRWAIREFISEDGDTQISWADTREEMMAYAADLHDIEAEPPSNNEPAPATPTATETAQEGLAEAVAESLAAQEPQPITATPVQRSDSPWTEERLTLLARIYPTIMSLEAMREALMALPGLEIATADAVKMKAQRLNLHRRGAPIPDEFAEAAPVRTRSIGGLASNGGKPGTWTRERVALLRRDYPSKRPLDDILADVNALPGPAVPTIGAVAAHAKKLDLSRRQPPEVGPAIPGTPTPMSTEDKAEALERLRTGTSRGARDIVDYFGCTAEEAQELVDRHRAKMGKAA